MRSRNGGHDASPTEETRGAGAPAHTYRSEPNGPHPAAGRPPLGRNKTIGDRPNRPLSQNGTVRPRDRARNRTLRDRPLNRETLSDRLAPLTIPQQTANRPEQPIERSKHDSQTGPKDSNARVDDESLHHEAHGASASVTTTKKPMLRTHATRVIERARKRDAIAERHFQSNLSCRMGRLVCCR